MANHNSNFNTLYLFAAWMGFIAFHIVCIVIDWTLRDHASLVQPMPGGIPVLYYSLIAYGSIFSLGVTVFYYIPSSWSIWIKFLLALIQVAVAYFIVWSVWIYYVLSNNIDTL